MSPYYLYSVSNMSSCRKLFFFNKLLNRFFKNRDIQKKLPLGFEPATPGVEAN